MRCCLPLHCCGSIRRVWSVRYKHSWRPSIEVHVEGIVKQYDKLVAQSMHAMAREDAHSRTISQRLHQLEPIVELYRRITDKKQEQHALSTLITEDESFRDLARHDLETCQEEIETLQSKLIDRLVPRERVDVGDAILEVRAGTGGTEASLFAAEVFAMYQRHAAFRGWRFEILDRSFSHLSGGVKEAVASVAGSDVFGAMKHETGVHRVQRIPTTDSQHRIHTSTVTVAVLPQPEQQADVVVNPSDVRVETFRSSGPGGQHANKTESAVRMTHVPSGIVVSVQEDRSQLKNRAKAMKIIAARLFDGQRRMTMTSLSGARKAQIGSGDRSERIRTYNFMQDRVTDHRISHSASRVRGFLQGEDALAALIDTLNWQHALRSLSNVVDHRNNQSW